MSSPDPVRYRNIIRAITSTPWAVLPSTLEVIAELVSLRAAGGRLSAEEIEQRIEAGPGSRQPYQASGGAVAVIPLTGVLMPRATLMSALSGGTSLQNVCGALDAAAADPEISAIVLDVDSPGGSVSLVPETAARVRAAAAHKRVVAIANGCAASAAYWIASQADELVITPSGLVGSIGVLAAHENIEAAEAERGVETTLIHAGRYKVEGHPYGPLDDEARSEMQRMVDEFYGMFVGDVAKGRGVSTAAVRKDYGEGRVVSAKRAMAAGMADRVETFDDLLARVLRAPAKPRAGARAELSPSIAAEDLLEDPDAVLDDQGPDAPNDDRVEELLAQIRRTVTDTTMSLKEA